MTVPQECVSGAPKIFEKSDRPEREVTVPNERRQRRPYKKSDRPPLANTMTAPQNNARGAPPDEARGAATMQLETFSEISRNSQFPGPKYFANEIFLVLQELISILRQGLRQRYQHPRHGHAHHSHAFTRCLRALRTCLGPETSKIAILRGYGHDSKKSSSISLSQLWVCRYLCRNLGGVDISVAIWGMSISLSQFRVCRYLCRNLGYVDISVASLFARRVSRAIRRL